MREPSQALTMTSRLLDLLDALVRKSLMVAAHSAGRTRYSMLETIRQFAAEQLAGTGDAAEARTAHARYFAATGNRCARRCGTAPDSARRTNGLPPNWPICAPLFGGPPTTATSTIAATIATYAAFLGFLVENYEPSAWAEELIEPACAIDHPRLAFLYVIASQCYYLRTR